MQREVHRRRLAALALLVTLGLGGLISGVGPRLADGIRRLVPGAAGPAPIEKGETLLLAWPTGDQGSVLVLLGLAPEQDRASALLVPSGTQVEIPSLGSETLDLALRFGGGELVSLSVANALGVAVDRTLVLEAGALGSVLTATGPLEVRLREPVVLGDQGLRSGSQIMGADRTLQLLTEQQDSDLDHLVAVHAVLEAWLGRLDGDVLGIVTERLVEHDVITDDQAEGTAVFLDELARRSPRFDTLDVESLGIPDGERYRLAESARGELDEMFAGSLLAGADGRLRIEIRNGTGEVGLSAAVAERLVPAGAEVVLTGNAGQFGVEKTVFVVHDERRQAEAQELVDALGVGELRRARSPVSVVDVSIVVGEDFDAGGE